MIDFISHRIKLKSKRGGGVHKLRLFYIAVALVLASLVWVIAKYFFPCKLSDSNLNVCFYGDSITALGNWEQVLDSRCNFNNMYVRGIGGTTFAPIDLDIYLDADGNYCGRSTVDMLQPDNTVAINGELSSMDRIQKTIPKDTDLIFIMGGTNDFSYNIDERTFKVSVEECISNLKDWLGEDAVIVLMSPVSGRDPTGDEDVSESGQAMNGLDLTTEDYAEWVLEVADERGIFSIDIFNDTLIRQYNSKLFLRDGLHPNYLGELEIERVVVGWLDKHF